RDDLDPFLDRLRQGGFIQLTDWVAGKGQGYRLTPAGVQLLERPRLLAAVQAGQLPAGPGPMADEPVRDTPTIYHARREAIRAASWSFTCCRAWAEVARCSPRRRRSRGRARPARSGACWPHW